jgi:hypothetical protein
LIAPGCDAGVCAAGPGFGKGNGLCLQGVGDTLYGLGVPYVSSRWHDSTLAQLNKMGTTTSSTVIDRVFADAVDFAFWGGKFWIFADDGGSSTSVNVYDPATGTVSVVLKDIGFEVDVASTSTCAPAVMPK